MTTMTENVNNKIDLTRFKDMDASQINEAIKKDRKNIAKLPKEETEKLFKFAQTKPGSEDRNKFFEQPVEQIKEPEKKIDESVEPVAPAAVEQPPKEPEPPVASEEPTLDELKERLRKTTEESKKHRDANARVGTELHRTREEVDKLKKELEELRKSQPTEQKQEIPEPEPPDPEKYDEGTYDPQYSKDLAKFTKDLKQWIKHNNEARTSNKEFEEVKQLTRNAQDVIDKFTREKQEVVSQQQWDDMWKRVEGIQKNYKLNTSIDARTISECGIITTNPGNYTPEEVKAATDILKKLTKSELDNFNVVSKITNELYSFESGYPLKRSITGHDDIDEMTIMRNNGLKLSPVAVELTTQDKIKNKSLTEEVAQQFVRTPSAANLGSEDDRISSDKTRAELKAEYLELSKEYQRRIKKGINNLPPDMEKRYKWLSEKLGLR